MPLSNFEVRPGGSVGCWPSPAPVCKPDFWSNKSESLILIHSWSESVRCSVVQTNTTVLTVLSGTNNNRPSYKNRSSLLSKVSDHGWCSAADYGRAPWRGLFARAILLICLCDTSTLGLFALRQRTDDSDLPLNIPITHWLWLTVSGQRDYILTQDSHSWRLWAFVTINLKLICSHDSYHTSCLEYRSCLHTFLVYVRIQFREVGLLKDTSCILCSEHPAYGVQSTSHLRERS